MFLRRLNENENGLRCGILAAARVAEKASRRSPSAIKGWALWHCHQTLPIYVKTFFHPPPFVLSIVIYRDEGVWTQTFLKRGSFKWKIPRMSELKEEAAIRNINESGINETLPVSGRRAHLKAGTFVSASSLFSTLDRRVALRHQ